MSVEQNVEIAGLIFQTLWGLLTRETSPKQLMGPVGDRAALGRIGAARLDRAASSLMAIDQPEPRPAQPAADPGPRRRPHLHHGARGRRAPRLQHRVKEKMLLAGFVVLMMLMVTVIYNDLTRISWIERLMPWR